MDFCLIAAADLPLIWVILAVAVALGMVIFVHELGHFLVAKACGVKCEKFYLGFDIYGLKICKFRWGETEYGIGILPLGGYVKMLGQEDNPARLREEIERAKQKGDEASCSAGVPPADGSAGILPADGRRDACPTKKDEPTEKIDVAAAEKALYDPRSYLAKSVPQRMAIISAGVIMNVIFAFVCAVVAYPLGVKQLAPTIGAIAPGDSAWQVGIHPGDECLTVDGQKVTRFTDLMRLVSLGDHGEGGVPLDLYRPSDSREYTFSPVPVKKNIKRTIGITSGFDPTLVRQHRVTVPDSSAAAAEPKFQDGDRVVAVDGRPVGSYGEIHAYLAANRDRATKITVRRSDGAEVVVSVRPNPMRQLAAGLEMGMGPITAIQEGSPAAKAGIRPGDVIEGIVVRGTSEPAGDPMTLPYRCFKLARGANRTIDVKVLRDGERETVAGIELRRADWSEQPIMDDNPLSIPELGVAYRVENRVANVVPGSSAAKAGFAVGDVVVLATLQPPKGQSAEDKWELSEGKVKFNDDKKRNWPYLISRLQRAELDCTVELTMQDDRKISVEPTLSSDCFNPDRGLLFSSAQFTETAENFADALRLGGRETWESLTMVVAVLKKIGTGDVSPKGLGGPGMIAVFMGSAVRDGLAQLLIVLCMISANLAVLNILPIPLLDGGHMVFLAWEGITRKPASERVQTVLTFVGLAFILTLMIWVIGLDILRLLRSFGIDIEFLDGA